MMTKDKYMLALYRNDVILISNWKYSKEERGNKVC